LLSLQAELGIANDSPDGRMLVLIARSLDFVADLRLGELLPVEVLGGSASWQPSAMHQQLAASRMKLQLISQLDGNEPTDWSKAEPKAVLAAAANPATRLRLQAAYIEAAVRLELPDPAAAMALAETVAYELGFVEAMRDRLLRRVLRMLDRIRHLAGTLANNLSGLEVVSRVKRLTGIAIDRITARFAEVDGQTETVLDTLRLLDVRCIVIRQHRDWLYCSLRGWEPILAAWEAASFDWCDSTWPLLGRTYRFLAPRFMPMQEWQLANRVKLQDGAPAARMVW
jgi:predicted regulator of Ras-like GTPase activity (Roadblock/LC7/MglB family)